MSIYFVVYFELFTFIICGLGHYFLLPLIGKIGIKKTMILSYFLTALTCLILYFGNTIHTKIGSMSFLFLIVIFNSLPLIIYWSAHHVYFLSCTGGKNDGHKLGILASIPLLIGIAGPFLGAFLIEQYSYREVFLLASFLLLIATFALSPKDDIYFDFKLKTKKIWDLKNLRKNTVFFLQGLGYCATTFIWPVILFFSSIQIITMGIFYLLSNLLNAIIIYLGGDKADSKNIFSILKLGTLGHSLSLILRALSSTVVYMATFQSIGGVFSGLLNIGIDTNFYKYSHKDIANAIANRELYMYIGRIVGTFVLIYFLLFFDNIRIALTATLLLTGITTFLFLFIFEKDTSFMKPSTWYRFNIFD